MAVSAAAAARTSATRDRVVARHRNEYRKRTDRYFAGFYRRNVGAFRSVAAEVQPTKADASLTSEIYAKLGRISWDQETRILSSSVEPVMIATVDSAFRLVGEELGAGISFDLNARPIRQILGGVGTRIQQVTDSSRTYVARSIAEGIDKGLSVEQIVRGVPPGTVNVRGPVPEFLGIRGLVDSWTSTGMPGFAGGGTGRSSRSYLIALTETGNAYNLSAMEAYAQGGVDFVEVFDGQDCGWSNHADPDLAHGSIRSLSDAQKHPLSHPRCQRAFAAREDATEARPSPYSRDESVPGATPGIGAVDPLDANAVAHSGKELARPRADVAEASQRAFERARIAEADITRALQQVTDGRSVTFEQAMAELPAAPGGDLAGLAARRKGLSSLSRKIDSEIVEAAKEGELLSAAQAADRIGDTVRYTVRFAEGEYVAGQEQIVRELLDAGMRLKSDKWKVKWADDVDKGYRGINSNFVSPNGTTFEVQFHTARSFVVKELNHPLYEEARLLTTSVARKQALYEEMAQAIATVKTPPGTMLTLDDVLALQARSVAGEKLSLRLAPPPIVAPQPPPAPVLPEPIAPPPAPTRLTSTTGRFELTAASHPELASSLDDVARARALVESPPPGVTQYAAQRELIRAVEKATAEIAKARRAMDAELAAASYDELLALMRQTQKDLKPYLNRISRVGSKPSMLRTAQQEIYLAEARLAAADLESLRRLLERRLELADRILPKTTRSPELGKLYDDVLAATRVMEESGWGRTRWTGRIKRGTGARNAAGVFDWDDTIGLSPDTLAKPTIAREMRELGIPVGTSRVIRNAEGRATGYRYYYQTPEKLEADYWHVVIHESFHGMRELGAADFRQIRGWEEGIVEMATQTFEARIRSRLGVESTTEAYRTYSEFTKPLERLRNAIGMEAEEFYGRLISVPAVDRPGLAAQMAREARARLGPLDLGLVDLDNAWSEMAKLGRRATDPEFTVTELAR